MSHRRAEDERECCNQKKKKAVSPVIVVIYVFLVLLAVLYLAPLLWMLSVSLKDNAGVMAAPFALPETFHLENYTQAWSLASWAQRLSTPHWSAA